MEHVRVEATSATRGTLLVTGGFSPAGGQIEVNGKDIALQPFNPYATAYSPYSISSGGLVVTTRARFRKGRYDSTTALKLLKFDLGGKEGDTLFAQQFGIPLSVALALLKDLQGNIGLDVALAGDARGAGGAAGRPRLRAEPPPARCPRPHSHGAGGARARRERRARDRGRGDPRTVVERAPRADARAAANAHGRAHDAPPGGPAGAARHPVRARGPPRSQRRRGRGCARRPLRDRRGERSRQRAVSRGPLPQRCVTAWTLIYS